MLCDHCVRLCVVFFNGCLVFSALLMYFVCEFEIVHTSVRCVLELLVRAIFGGVRFAG